MEQQCEVPSDSMQCGAPAEKLEKPKICLNENNFNPLCKNRIMICWKPRRRILVISYYQHYGWAIRACCMIQIWTINIE